MEGKPHSGITSDRREHLGKGDEEVKVEGGGGALKSNQVAIQNQNTTSNMKGRPKGQKAKKDRGTH